MRLAETYNAYLQYLVEDGAAVKTIRAHKQHLFGSLSHSIQDMEIEKMNIADIESKVKAAGRQHGKHGENKAISICRSLFKYLKKKGYQVPDWRDIETVSQPKNDGVEYLDEDELERLRGVIDVGTVIGLRTRTLLELLYSTGCRITEALMCDRDDVDWYKRRVRITNSKTKVQNKVYISNPCIEWLKKYLEKRKDDVKALFIGGRKKRLTIGTSGSFMRKMLKKANIPKRMCHHIVRKTFVTTLIDKGLNLKHAQHLARHKSPRMTLEYYAGLDEEKAEETHRKVFDAT